MPHIKRWLVMALCLSAAAGPALPAPADKAYAPPAKGGINKDAMTMQECRDRLAAPPKQRPQSDDSRINLDAMCKNMLSEETGKLAQRKRAARAASAANARPR